MSNRENVKYLARITDNSMIMYDEVIESYVEETNFSEKKATCRTKNLYILLPLLLITISLLIAVSISNKTKTFITNSQQE